VRVLIALGGNALTAPDGTAGPAEQIAAVGVAAEHIASVIAAGDEVLVTHGNGPQVGNLLLMNELAASQVAPIPLDWCDAQTQATIGLTLVNALERSLATRGLRRPVTAVVSRTLVARDDPGLSHPTKPVGRYLPAAEAALLMQHGEVWQDRGARGWRRVVASPEPLEILDVQAVKVLVDNGFVVVCGGGGGVPSVRDEDGSIHGVPAVIDKDLTAALLGHEIGAHALVIATDVEAAVLRYGTPDAEPIGEVTVGQMRTYAAEGHFSGGSMGPKVEAACRFVESGGTRSVIARLDQIDLAARGRVGTVVVPDPGWRATRS
jgi:carbamate kinase